MNTMRHKDYDNGYIAHNIEERLKLPCGAVRVWTDLDGAVLAANNRTGEEIPVVKSDLVHFSKRDGQPSELFEIGPRRR